MGPSVREIFPSDVGRPCSCKSSERGRAQVGQPLRVKKWRRCTVRARCRRGERPGGGGTRGRMWEATGRGARRRSRRGGEAALRARPGRRAPPSALARAPQEKQNFYLQLMLPFTSNLVYFNISKEATQLTTKKFPWKHQNA